jgi:hypothetical protein
MKIWDKDNWILLATLLYAFLLAYFAPSGIARIGFLPLLLFAFTSKNNAFWLVILLVFIDNPAYLFASGERELLGRTPIYPFIGGGIGFTELLAFTLIFKSLKSNGVNLLYRKGLGALTFVLLLSFLISFAYTVNGEAFVAFIRRLTMLIFIFSLPRLMASRQDWLSFFKLIFPFVFLIFLDQLQIYLTGRPIAALFSADVQTYRAMREVVAGAESVSRALSASVMLFFIFTGALLILFNDELRKNFQTTYLYIAIAMAYLAIMLSATRGWFISFTVMFILIAMTAGGKKLVGNIIPYTTIAILFISIIISTNPLLQTQLVNAWARISTIGLVAQGDFTAGGTAQRWTAYLPELMKHIKESPFGYGFSSTAFSLENDHVGLVNPIITLGIQGYLVLLTFIFMTMNYLYRMRKWLFATNPFRNSLLVVIVIFTGAFIIHIVTRQIFGLNKNVNVNMMVAILFAVANWVYVEAISFNNQISNSISKQK